jgi:hypothetical protein
MPSESLVAWLFDLFLVIQQSLKVSSLHRQQRQGRLAWKRVLCGWQSYL